METSMKKQQVRFLGIDDNPDNLVVLKAILQETYPGCIFIGALSGKEGLKICREQLPDVILLDIIMPVMDGFEVCARIKTDDLIRHIPVIMLTAAQTTSESRIRALKTGADAFLAKPIDNAELMAQVSAMLRLKAWEDERLSENERLEELVRQRTIDLERELSERVKAEKELQITISALEKSKRAALNLMADLKKEMEERKQAENAVKMLNEELEQRVMFRTAQLEASNKELEAFSYSVSHDLRAPLRAINGFAKILLDDYKNSLDEEGIRLLNILRDNAKNLSTLIDDLLAFARLQRQDLQKNKIEMSILVDEVYNEMIAIENPGNIELIIGDLPEATGDISMIRQVWRNIIENAIKFTKPRTERLIEVGAMDSDGTTVYFVKDNGVGFDMKFADKIFGVFQRLHTAAQFEGTGVGLALVQRIINRHNGRIWTEATPNEGAVFYFTLAADSR
jgi:signal transduction histidine kinase